MICPGCGREVVLAEEHRFCQYCGHDLLNEAETVPEIRLDTESESASGEPITAEDRQSGPNQYCPWEDHENLGFTEGILQTLKGSLFSPKAFFERLPRDGGFVNPLLFALIIETLGSLLGYLWSFSVDHTWLGMGKISGYLAVLLVLLVPFFVFLGIVVWTALLHLSLFLVGGASRGFEATFRVVCYSSGPELLNVVPFVGSFAGIVWKICLAVIGLREVHETSTGRAVTAVLLPLIVCCAFLTAGIIALAFTVSLAGNH